MIYVTYQQAVAVSSVFWCESSRFGRGGSGGMAVCRNSEAALLITITCVAFIASFVFSVPFPLVIVGAALAGLFIPGDDSRKRMRVANPEQGGRQAGRASTAAVTMAGNKDYSCLRYNLAAAGLSVIWMAWSGSYLRAAGFVFQPGRGCHFWGCLRRIVLHGATDCRALWLAERW